MADVRPFYGVHYNPTRVNDLAKVICPPYDIISSQEQQELYRRSDFNFVRVEYGRELPNDKGTDNKYTRAAAFLAQWSEQQVLVADEAPAIYVSDHEFPHRDKTFHRREINCLVRLEDWDKNIVRPHEGTLSCPKSDRLNLLWALQADTSPIMALFEDCDGVISRVLEASTSGRPLLTAAAGNSESQRLWAINDENSVDQICRSLASQPIYIADGHHRYESALTYRRERRTCAKPAPEDQPYDFVMMTLVDFADPGLIILPAHRLVRGLAQSSLDSLMDRLKSIFGIEGLPADAAAGPEPIDNWLSGGKDEVKLLLYGPGRERLYRLTLRDLDSVRPMIPYFHSEFYQRLDVSIVDHVILEELLGLTHEAAGVYIDYTNDALEAIKRIREREYQLAVIVNPVKPGAIKAIADVGDRMPHKSTYFYPKVPAGLVLYKF